MELVGGGGVIIDFIGQARSETASKLVHSNQFSQATRARGLELRRDGE